MRIKHRCVQRARHLACLSLASWAAFSGAAAFGAGNATTYRAWNFTQSIGVNTHISWQNQGSAYANPAVVEQCIAYLGATHVRDGVPYQYWTLPEYIDIAATGVQFDIVASGPTIDFAGDQADASLLAQAVPGSVASMEGANEFNTQNSVYDSINSLNNPPWAQLYGPPLYAATQSNTALAGVQVIAASMANAGQEQLQQEGDLSAFVDSSNWHTYFGNGDQPGPNLAASMAYAQSTAPGKPVSITETGYYTAIDAMQWGGGGVSKPVQAILTVNALFDSFSDGAEVTYLYELLDNIANPSNTDLEDSFGLFLADGTPKPAGSAIHNLASILADPGQNAANFATAQLAATISGLPADGSSLTLEKSDGTFDLIIWREPQVWDEATKSEVRPQAAVVTVNFAAMAPAVRLFRPLASALPVRVATNASKIQFPLAARPVIVEISPGANGP
jgi:hypothetical protein